MSNYAWVTLATNDSYSLGALVVAFSLKRVHTAHQLACLITPGVSESMKEKLSTIFNVVQEVNLLDSADSANLALLQRPELGVTFTKLHCWRLTQYDKCVFLDADTLVIQNCDELFEREELSAAPDVGWPDCFNSGVFVFKPSMDTYSSILKFAIENGSFDGGDQGLLNLYFADWAHKDISKHLPFLYNTSSVATYSYMPAFKQFGENVKIVHFIGTMKPWIQNFDSETKQVNVPGGYNHLAKFLQFWWDIFCEDVHPNLTSDMVCIGLASALAKLQLGKPKSKEQVEYEEHMRRHYWETGSMDYMGRDKFDNIWAKIQETINGSGKQEAGPSQQRRTKSRSRSGTPKRDMKDRSPTPPAEDVVLGEKKEVYKIDATIKEEEIHENIVDEKPMSPPFVHYDPTTNTTTLTKKVFAGYQQIITTKTLEGKTKIQTKTFFDPALDEECLGVDDVEQMIENDEKSNVEVMQEVVELSEVVKVKVEEEIPENILLQKALETVECMSESIDKVIEQVDELNIDKSSEQDFVILKEPEIDIIEEICTLKASTKPTETQMMPINIDESIEVILPEIRMVVDVEGPQEITQAESILHSNNDFVIVPENTETPSKETEFELVECPKNVLSQKCETTQIESEILPQIIKEVESIPLSHDEMPEPNIEELNGHAPIVENESTEENAASESSTPLQGQLQLQEQSLAGKPIKAIRKKKQISPPSASSIEPSSEIQTPPVPPPRKKSVKKCLSQ